jgi:hypothetical protein
MTAAGSDASFSDLAAIIVTSRQFRNRAGENTLGTGPKAGAERPDERRVKARASQSRAGMQ